MIGSLEYRRKGAEAMALGMFQGYIPDTRDAWSFTLDSLRDFFEKVMAQSFEMSQIQLPQSSLVNALTLEVPELAYEIMGTYLGAAELLGQRTAEMHIALATDTNDPSFAPEPFTLFHQRSVYQYMRNQAGQIFLRLKKQLKKLPTQQQSSVRTLLNEQGAILDRYKRIVDQPISAMRIRCHGNYHLEEVLYTGKDFVIIDFEGEASRPLSERRMKRSPIRDVAGMVQSFYYASRVALQREVESGVLRTENLPSMEQWTQFLYYWTSVVFLKKYLATAADASFVPQTKPELQVLLDAFLLEKAVYELGYEMDTRPDWTDIPLHRILELLGISAEQKK
jgi:maltose alpha-D-glucosyltransferase/alpha-amylase